MEWEEMRTTILEVNMTSDFLSQWMHGDAQRPYTAIIFSTFFGFCYLMIGFLTLTNNLSPWYVLLGAIIWANGTLWVYGDPWLYDLDRTVTEVFAQTLMLKMYGILFIFLLVILTGKIIPRSRKVHLVGRPMLTYDRVEYTAIQMERMKAIGY